MQVHQIDRQQPALVSFQSAGWRGVVRADWADHFGDVDLVQWVQQFPHELTRDRMSRRLYFVHAPNRDVYAKVMVGTNDRAIEQPSLGARLRWSLRPSRAMQTLRVCRRMIHAGVLCPPPVLAARKWTRGMPTDVFINDAIDGRGVGDRISSAEDNAARVRIIERVVPHIEKLHRAHFLHGDLLPNNLIADAEFEHICFLDNDRTRHWPIGLSTQRRCENIFQFAFRLLQFGEEVSVAFIDAYAQAAGWPRHRHERHRMELLKDIRERMARRVAKRGSASHGRPTDV